MRDRSKIFLILPSLTLLILTLFSGGTSIWATGSFLILIFFNFASWSIYQIFYKKTLPETLSSFVPSFFLIILALFTLFQMIPLPISLMKVFSPFYYDLLCNLLPFSTSHHPLSFYPFLTSQELLKILGYTTFCFLVATYMENGKLRKNLCYAIIISGLFETVYGLTRYYLLSHEIIASKSPLAAVATGTFINRNHYSAYLNLCFWITLSRLFSEVSKVWRSVDSWRERIILIFSEEMAKAGILLLASFLMCIGILFSGSRGGLINLVSAFGCLLFLSLLRRQNSFKNFLLFSSVIGIFVFLLIFFVHSYGKWPFIERWITLFKTGVSQETARIQIWKDSLNIMSCFPWFGSGAGTFIHIFPYFQSEMIVYSAWGSTIDMVVDHAHSDYLEWIAETGWVGIFIFLIATIWIGLRIFRNIKNTSGTHTQLTLLAIFSGIFGFSIHSIIEFNLHVPANMFLFLTVVTLALILPKSRRAESNRDEVEPKREKNHFWNIPILIFILCFCTFGSIYAYRLVISDIAIEKVNHLFESSPITQVTLTQIDYYLGKAITHTPKDANLWYQRTRLMRQNYQKGFSHFSTKEFYEQIQSYLNKAISLDPFNPKFYAESARVETELAQISEKYSDLVETKVHLKKALVDMTKAEILAPNSFLIKEKLELARKNFELCIKEVRKKEAII